MEKELSYYWAWEFQPELNINSKILCPECNTFSLWSEWDPYSEVGGCDLCDTHAALECPRCRYPFDHIYSDSFTTC
jgi:hypothetical protein